MNNDDMNDFLNTYINYGIVVRGTLEEITKIKEHLASIPDVKLVYQKLSINNLLIQEKPSNLREDD